MRCEDAIETLRTASASSPERARAALLHAADCEDCRAVLRALDALRICRDEPVPMPSDGAMERAIDSALARNSAHRYRHGFWTGVASGAALAATIAAIAVGLSLRAPDDSRVVPEVRVVVNRPHDVTVTFESAEPLANAEVRVELRGAVALDGYAGRRELRWSTDLDRGINRLTLPVVALDASGGQVLVELAHGDKRRAFLLDVLAASAG